MGSRTCLYDHHLAAGARMVDFGGWDMPVHYGSQIDEHHAVRGSAGMFDVSHMTVVDLHGAGTRAYLSRLLANDVSKLKTPGKALYSCMLTDDGGVIDDLIVYYLSDTFYRVVVNAATREKDLAWMRRQLDGFESALTERADLAMIAVQGPAARDRVAALLESGDGTRVMALKPFFAAQVGGLFVARTGYTGEDGFEIIMPDDRAPDLWQHLVGKDVAPCGLGARDTLRLEAGMNLYGQDMDETTTPLESGLDWTVAMTPTERAFVGRKALQAQQDGGVPRKLVGLLLEGRGVLRSHQRVLVDGEPVGEVTSGTFSPTLSRSVGMARVSAGTGNRCQVEIRNRLLDASVQPLPFVRRGKVLIEV